MTQEEIDARARRENAADLWSRLWSEPASTDWRAVALARVYDRIIGYVPEGAAVLDFGGGVGALGEQIKDAKGAAVMVLDHSKAALVQAKARGLDTQRVDLEDPISVRTAMGIGNSSSAHDPIIVASEVLEHLSAAARFEFLDMAADNCHSALFTVPNNRLGPEVEPQHTIQFTAKTFARELRDHFDRVRIEVFGAYLVGVCGDLAGPPTGISMCLPVRDETADLEAVLASFRGFVDEIVVGVDPRTVDDTRAISEAYADHVFELEDPACQDESNPLHDPAVPPEGCHFSWVRNQCIDRCTSPWVFMTEGHERLLAGHDILLGVGELLADADVAYVWRRGVGQRWLFPWLARQTLRYKRSTHNIVDMPKGTRRALLREVVTFHDRDHGNAEKRGAQRRLQNRKTLWDDWDLHGNPASLFYFAQELRADDPEEAVMHFDDFLKVSDPRAGQMRYQARLILAKLYHQRAQKDAGDGNDILASHSLDECAATLHGCTAEDWTRTEHWLWLGDLAFNASQFEQAYQFYSYCGICAGNMPASVWWIDEATYLWLPAQRLAMCAGHLGKEAEALYWARRVLDLLPVDAPDEAFEEARRNIEIISEVITKRDAVSELVH